MFGPLLPGISDTDEAVAGLFAHAAKVGVDRVWTDMLNPRPRVWPSLQKVLRRHCPNLGEQYQRLLFDRSARRAYRRELDSRVREAARKAGLSDRLA
jgi:DNA repair photolyase